MRAASTPPRLHESANRGPVARGTMRCDAPGAMPELAPELQAALDALSRGDVEPTIALWTRVLSGAASSGAICGGGTLRLDTARQRPVRFSKEHSPGSKRYAGCA